MINKMCLINEDDVIIHVGPQAQPKSLHQCLNLLATSVCGAVRAARGDRLQISWWSNSQICHLLQQQINDNYPADMSTVITLQDQEQGEKELRKEGMKGSGPHLALS